MIENPIPSIVQPPAANPSTPSEKLTTFISPTSQITVSTPPVLGNSSTPRNGSDTSVTTAPASTAITAAAICPTSFQAGFRLRASSTAPTIVIRHAPATTPQVWTVPPDPTRPRVWCSVISSGSQIAPATSTPPPPPKCGPPPPPPPAGGCGPA